MIRGHHSGVGNMSPAWGYQPGQSVVRSVPGLTRGVSGGMISGGMTSRWVLTVDSAAGHRMQSIGGNSGGPGALAVAAQGPAVAVQGPAVAVQGVEAPECARVLSCRVEWASRHVTMFHMAVESSSGVWCGWWRPRRGPGCGVGAVSV